MIYNVSDHGAWCYTAYCKYINKTCLVVTTKPSYCKESTTAVPTTTESSTQHRSSSRPSTTTQQPTTKFVAKSCVNWNPPKKSGESWKESPCVNATCLDGIVTTYTTECKKQEPMVCANNFPATVVYDEDGCCPHYECQCICYGWGDPHYVTFDGTYYGFQGNCSYVLVKEIHPKYNFSVVIENYYCDAEDGLSCPQSLTVYYQQYTIFITHKDINGVPINMVFVDGLRVNPAFKNKDFGLATTGIDTVLFIESIGARITFSGLMFSVYLPYEEFNHNTEGQCGTCDNNRTNDCMLPSGEIALSCPYMAHEWQLNNSVCMHPPTPTPSPTTPVPSLSVFSILTIFNPFSSVFGKCHDVVPFEPFMVACNFDVCNMEIDIIGCTSIQTYAMACAEAGVCIDWRNATDGICGTIKAPASTFLLQVNETWEQGCDVCTCLGRENFTCQHIECPILPPLSCVQEGQIKVTETGECCPKQKCVLNAFVCVGTFVCSCTLACTCLYVCACLCFQGYEYQTIAGHCCGKCVQTSCIAVLPDNTTNTFLVCVRTCMHVNM
uniref:Mucin 5f n=1 Tax=Gadus morhua TaxID=8049 RepID=A0A8C5CIA8_GADMO